MTDIDPNTIITIIGTIGGTLGGVGLGSYLTGRQAAAAADQRAKTEADDRVRAWRRETIRHTRGLLRATIAGAEAAARPDMPAMLSAEEDRRRFEDGNIQLVGDEAAVRALQDLVVENRQLLGRTIPADYPVRSAKVVGALLAALDDQEERLLRNEPLLSVDPSVAPDLFRVESFADRLELWPTPPSLQGVFARLGIDVLRRRPRRKARSPDSADSPASEP